MRPKLRPHSAICPNCNILFPPKEKEQKLCSTQCKYEYKKKQNSAEWQCQQCSKKKIVTHSSDKKRKFCSRDCAVIASKGQRRSMSTETKAGVGLPRKRMPRKLCLICQEYFQPTRFSQKLCGRECTLEFNRRRTSARVTNTCEWCSKTFETLPCEARRFCDRKCVEAWKNREWEEGRLVLTAKPEDIKYRDLPSRTIEVGKIKSGKRHRQWRLKVLTRDNNTCQECGSKEQLHVHHIREFSFFPQDRYEIHNGITLCKECHNRLHKNMKRVGIIGLGWVGEFMNKQFPNALVYDPLRPEYHTKEQINRYCSAAFICVPTPNLPDGSLDTSIVEECVAWCTCPLIVIRSTLNPGTADRLAEKYKKRIVVNPEYLGETKFHPMHDHRTRDFIVLGGDSKDTEEVIGIYTQAYNANVRITQVTAKEAEIIKLTENRAIAFKVAQCQELYDICKATGANYYTIRDVVFGDDPRFNLWFTFIYPNRRGMDSKCIPKDVYAWAAWSESLGVTPHITNAILEKNKEWLSLNDTEEENEDLKSLPTREEIDDKKREEDKRRFFEDTYGLSVGGNTVTGEPRNNYRNDKWEKDWTEGAKRA